MAEAWATRTLEEDLLARAAEDWVHPSELLNIVRRSGVTDPSTLRDLAVGLLARMLVQELVLVGDVGDVYVPWSGPPGDVLHRVVAEWVSRDDPYVMPGELFWINTTNSGQAMGEAVLAREARA